MFKINQIKPNPDCRACYGSGEVIDWVPYGDTDVQMMAGCECVAEQVSQLEELAREAKALCDRLLQRIDELDTPETYYYCKYATQVYDKAALRMWRRLNALKAMGHTGPLWGDSNV